MLSPEKTLIFNQILGCLNSAFKADPGGMHCLMCTRVPTNQEMLDHPHVMVRREGVADYKSLGPLGVINGLLSAAGLPIVALQFVESEEPGSGVTTKEKKVTLTGFMMVPVEHQPDDIRKEMEGTTLEQKFAIPSIPTPDQKLWEFLGLAAQKDIDAGGKYDRLVGEIEKYFGVGDGSLMFNTKGDAAILALQELVDTKNMKDSGGKTPEYEARRLAAWEQAEKVLAMTKETT